MRRYPGKIILFGEYTILDDGRALAIPLKSIIGKVSFCTVSNSESNKNLQTYFNYLRRISFPNGVMLDLDLLRRDIDNGMIIKSNAKSGYGVGSSGIVTAAIFDKYYIGKKQLSIDQLKHIFSLMESFFHGKSSGVDPLVSFFNHPILIDEDYITLIDNLPENILNRFRLLDTGISRSTQPLVNWYKEKKKDAKFSSTMERLKQEVDHIIEAFLLNDKDSFENLLYKISQTQLRSLKKLIPEHLVDFWKLGLGQGKYITKICGAGGGGYLLVYILSDDLLPGSDMIPLI